MDADAFSRAVDDGLSLSKRIYAGKDRYATSAPARAAMEKSRPSDLLPTAPMVYAVIVDPAIVDNPDRPSYQPHVHGRCDPPPLIPLQMKEVEMAVDCHVDVAVVAVRGRWRVHCVMGSRSCDCWLVVPMGEKGSILGVEVDFARRSYSTQVIQREEQKMDTALRNESRGLLKPQYFSLTIPQVDGGCDISIKVSWSQKLLYKDGQFAISVPYHFPDYVTPFAKLFSKREKIQLNVNTGTGKEVVIQRTSHALKEVRRNVGKMSFLYEAEVEHWSTKDFHFSYNVHSNDLFGGILLQSPSIHDYDQREMFYMYLFPGSNPSRKVFRKEVVFLVDISGSMRGKPLENVKSALCSALLELTVEDNFNIIAFSEQMHSFSSSMEPATEDMIANATQWMSKNFVAEGGTDFMQPLNEAMGLLSKARESLPHIFLITDGAIEGERDICCAMRTHVTDRGSMHPRMSTFGIGSYCNHYFLQMLSSIGRGQYEAAYDVDSIEVQMRRWFRRALSPILANVSIDILEHLEQCEVYPFNIPDLSLGCPLVVSGRYEGKFPGSAKAKGSLADMNDMIVDLKVQNAKDILLDKVVAKQQIELLTAQAWLYESKQLEETVIRQSIQSGIPSEYTSVLLCQLETEKQDGVKLPKDKEKHGKNKGQAIITVCVMKLGFGDVAATLSNLPSGSGDAKPPETSNVLNKAVGCCSRLCDCCCCMCFIRMCSKLNDQCVIAITQLCMALSCLACSECCSEVCCDGGD